MSFGNEVKDFANALGVLPALGARAQQGRLAAIQAEAGELALEGAREEKAKQFDMAGAQEAARQRFPSRSAIPVEPEPKAAPAAPTQNSGQATQNTGQTPTQNKGPIGDALSFLSRQFGLGQRAAVGGTQSSEEGEIALLRGDGAAAPEEVEALKQAVDPKGELTDAARNLYVLNQGYEHYLKMGQPDKAAAYAASIVQYSTQQAAKFGRDAVRALKAGDFEKGIELGKKAYDLIPDGSSVGNVQRDQQGNLVIERTNTLTGDVTETLTASPQEFFSAVLDVANGKGAWDALIRAAATPEERTQMMKGEQLTAANEALASAYAPAQAPAIPGVQPAPSNAGAVNPAEAASFLDTLGATPNEKAALLAAAKIESSFNPAAVHDGGTGSGLFGHRGDRRTALLAAGGGEDNWQAQMKFALEEIRSRPEGAAVNSAQSPQELTAAVLQFLRPEGYREGAPEGSINYDKYLSAAGEFMGGVTQPGNPPASPPPAQSAAAPAQQPDEAAARPGSRRPVMEAFRPRPIAAGQSFEEMFPRPAATLQQQLAGAAAEQVGSKAPAAYKETIKEAQAAWDRAKAEHDKLMDRKYDQQKLPITLKQDQIAEIAPGVTEAVDRIVEKMSERDLETRPLMYARADGSPRRVSNREHLEQVFTPEGVMAMESMAQRIAAWAGVSPDRAAFMTYKFLEPGPFDSTLQPQFAAEGPDAAGNIILMGLNYLPDGTAIPSGDVVPMPAEVYQRQFLPLVQHFFAAHERSEVLVDAAMSSSGGFAAGLKDMYEGLAGSLKSLEEGFGRVDKDFERAMDRGARSAIPYTGQR